MLMQIIRIGSGSGVVSSTLMPHMRLWIRLRWYGASCTWHKATSAVMVWIRSSRLACWVDCWHKSPATHLRCSTFGGVHSVAFKLRRDRLSCSFTSLVSRVSKKWSRDCLNAVFCTLTFAHCRLLLACLYNWYILLPWASSSHPLATCRALA
jgi:hypothetical protein